MPCWLKRWEVSAEECLKIEPISSLPPPLLGGMYNDTDFQVIYINFVLNFKGTTKV